MEHSNLHFSLKEVSSNSNPTVAFALKVRNKTKFARQEELFFVEGQRECQRAIDCGLLVKYFFICDDLMLSLIHI